MENADTQDLRERFEFHKQWLEKKLQDEQKQNSKRDSQRESLQPINSSQGDRENLGTDSKARSNDSNNESLENEDTVDNLRNIITNPSGSNSLTRTEDILDSEDYLYRDFFDGQKRPKRWETLYGLNKKILQQKEINEKQNENKKNEIDPECTFQPKLIAAKPFYTSNNSTLSIHERNKQWKERKDAKIALTREVVKDKDLAGCTFKPEVERRKNGDRFEGITEYQSKGIIKYLQRQVVARKAKEEKEAILNNPMKKLPEGATKKEGNFTIPKAPKFQTEVRAAEYESIRKSATPMQFSKYSQGSTNLGSALITPLGERSVNNTNDAEASVDSTPQVRDSNFVNVLGALHNELYKFDIRYG